MQGGSTLTQQLAKNMFLSQEQTMSRKVYEVMFSLMLEDKFSKDQILEMYFNTTYFATAQPASLPLHAVTSVKRLPK